MPWHCTLCNTPLQEVNNAVQVHILKSPACRHAVFSEGPVSSPVSSISGSISGSGSSSGSPNPSVIPIGAQQLVGDTRAIDCYFALNQIGVCARNLGVPLARNIISVGIPTAIREAIRRGPLAMLSTASPYATFGLGIGACTLPIVTEIIGLARDQRNGNQTPLALLSRVLLIMAVGSTCVTAIAMGTLTTAAPALIAANVFYTPLRDVAQYFIQVGGGYENGTSQGATALSAAAYFINQLAVNFGMDAVVAALQPALSAIVSNIIGRSVLNVVGETADDIVSRYLNAIATSRTTPTFTLGLRSRQDINRTTAYDQIFNINSSRSSLFATLFNFAYYVKEDAWSNIGAAGSVALAYIPFINVASQTTSVGRGVDVNALETGRSGVNIPTAPLTPSVTVVNERVSTTHNMRRSLSQRSSSSQGSGSNQGSLNSQGSSGSPGSINSQPRNPGLLQPSPAGGPEKLEIITRY